MIAKATSAREVAARVIKDLSLSGIDQAAAVRVTQELIAHAQQATLTHGGSGDANEIAALLIAATTIILGYATNKGSFSYAELIAAVEGAHGLRLLRAAPKGE